MKTYTYSEARQRLAAVLDEARREGRVQIRRQDGSTFVVHPVVSDRSPLDVQGSATGFAAGSWCDWFARNASGPAVVC